MASDTEKNRETLYRILLIEDDSSHSFIVARALKGICREVITVGTLSDAIEAIKDSQFDFIISDLHLPDSDNPISTLKSEANDIPVIVLTSSTSLAEGIEAMKLGARDYIVKNFDASFKDVLSLALTRVGSAIQVEHERMELRRETEVLRAAIENGEDAFAVIDRQGNILYKNSSFARFVDSCGGNDANISSIFSETVCDHEQLIKEIKNRLTNFSAGTVWTTEILLRNDKDASSDLVLSIISKDSDKDDGRGVIWVRDARERKRRERFQREILSTTTHDLKGPLGAIALSCEVLLDDEVGEKKDSGERARKLVERIASSATNAIQLIEEFLNVRRIEEGTLVMKPINTEINPLVKESLEEFTSAASSRGITLKTDCTGGDLHGCVDPLGFKRILMNLISNAIKFTQKGGDITVVTEQKGEDLILSVHDTGSGIEPTEVPRLFQRFSRLKKHEKVGGTGLGLFIVKSIVDAHGGKVEVISEIKKGTTFKITFPGNPPMNDCGESICLSI